MRKVPVVAVSVPGPVQTAVPSGPKTNSAVLKTTTPQAALASVTDNEVTCYHTQRSTGVAVNQMSKWEHIVK